MYGSQYWIIYSLSLLSGFLSFLVVIAIFYRRHNVLTYRLIALLCFTDGSLQVSASFKYLNYNSRDSCLAIYSCLTFFNSMCALSSLLLSVTIFRMLKYGPVYQRLRDQIILLLVITIPSLILTLLWIFPYNNYIIAITDPSSTYCSIIAPNQSNRDTFLSEFLTFRLPVLVSVVGSCIIIICLFRSNAMATKKYSSDHASVETISHKNPVIKDESRETNPSSSSRGTFSLMSYMMSRKNSTSDKRVQEKDNIGKASSASSGSLMGRQTVSLSHSTGVMERQNSENQLKVYQLLRLFCFPFAFVFSQIFDMIGHAMKYHGDNDKEWYESYRFFQDTMLSLQGTFFFSIFLLFPKSREVIVEFLMMIIEFICKCSKKKKSENHIVSSENNFDLGEEESDFAERDSDLDSLDIELSVNEKNERQNHVLIDGEGLDDE